MKPGIRAARLPDLPGVVALETTCFRHPGERFHRGQVRRLFLNPRACVRVVRREGVAVAWAAGLLRRHGRIRSGRLYALAVHPQYRGRRIGLKLARSVLTALRRRGARRISLEVRIHNRGAQRLYTSLGFLPAEPLPHYYGSGLHGLRMRHGAG